MLISFIKGKSPQLCFYLRGFWAGKLPYPELQIFFWDTIEEWSQVHYNLEQPYSKEERVFWHVLHQLQYWNEDTLHDDTILSQELLRCLEFLEGKGIYPFDCVGIRP